jgi:hypothetical protein
MRWPGGADEEPDRDERDDRDELRGDLHLHVAALRGGRRRPTKN